MQIFKTIAETTAYVNMCKKEGKTIGFVPTMGFLHEGHISLLERAALENNVAGMSIFVNPTQFAANEDFSSYPRDLERDAKIAEAAGADFLFAPDAAEMYPEGYQTYTEVEKITKKLCGISRPTHFRGVTTVVQKLLNISRADRAYFGQKDAQQLLVIRRMVRDLNMSVEIVACPIIREADGLAKSSRNTYLSTAERTAALCLSRGLFKAKSAIENGETEASKIRAILETEIKAEPLADIDYISIVDTQKLEETTQIEKDNTLVALAVRFGTTRLIDNIMI